MQAPHQVGGRIGISHAFLAVDLRVHDEAGQRFFESLRSFSHGFLHGFAHAREVAFFNEIGHQLGVEHDLDRRHPAAVGLAHQALRHHGLEGRCQVAQHGGAYLDRVEAQDTVERVVAVVAVQRGQAQVTRLRIGNGSRHGFAVADFADQDHVGRLAQRVLQGGLQGLGVAADFALVDDGLLVPELVLDRVLDSEDVACQRLVAGVDHRRQRGALARARGAHHQDETALFHDELAHHRGQAQGVELGDLMRDEADHHRIAATLAHGADPEAAHTAERHTHVEFAGFLQLFDAVRGDHFRQQVARCVGRQDLVVDGHALAIDLDQRGGVGRQIDVGGLFLCHQAKNSFHRAHGVSLLLSVSVGKAAHQAALMQRNQSRSRSLMLVLERVCASTCLTMMAAYML